MTCRKANAGFRVNDCFEACENTPGAISQVWKRYANNIFARLPDSHSDHSCLLKEHTGVSTGTRSPHDMCVALAAMPQEHLLHFECGFRLHWSTSEFMCVGVEKGFIARKID